MTFAEILAQIQEDQAIPAWRRSSIAATFRSISRQLDIELAKAPATLAIYQEIASRFSPKLAAIGRRRWTGMKCDIRFVLQYAGVPDVPWRSTFPLTGEWESLLGKLSPTARKTLARFVRFCSERCITPGEVNDKVADEFREVVSRESVGRKRDYTHRSTLTYWNRAVTSIPDWPKCELLIPSNHRCWTLSLDAYPFTFQSDLDAYLAWLSQNHALGAKTPERALKPVTIKSMRHSVRYMAGALVAEGRDPKTITSLRDLVEEEACKTALRYLHQRRGGNNALSVCNIAVAMRLIAERWLGFDTSALNAIDQICKRLRSPGSRVNEKYSRRLHQLDDPQSLRRLLTFPLDQLERVRRIGFGDRIDAVKVQIAVAVELLLMAPVRIGQLASVSLDEHLQWHANGDFAKSLIRVPNRQAIERQPQEFELPAESTDLLRTYVDDYRPKLAEPANRWLFPGQRNQPKHSASLARQIKIALKEETGLVINAHLFRFIAAKLYLEANPGSFEVVRRLLGHQSLKTTFKMCANMEAAAASRHYDKKILLVTAQSI